MPGNAIGCRPSGMTPVPDPAAALGGGHPPAPAWMGRRAAPRRRRRSEPLRQRFVPAGSSRQAEIGSPRGLGAPVRSRSSQPLPLSACRKKPAIPEKLHQPCNGSQALTRLAAPAATRKPAASQSFSNRLVCRPAQSYVPCRCHRFWHSSGGWTARHGDSRQRISWLAAHETRGMPGCDWPLCARSESGFGREPVVQQPPERQRDASRDGGFGILRFIPRPRSARSHPAAACRASHRDSGCRSQPVDDRWAGWISPPFSSMARPQPQGWHNTSGCRRPPQPHSRRRGGAARR